jgi:hypothetical protein
MVLIDLEDKTLVVEEQVEEKPMTPLVMTTTLTSKPRMGIRFAQHANQTCTTSKHVPSNLHFVKRQKEKLSKPILPKEEDKY